MQRDRRFSAHMKLLPRKRITVATTIKLFVCEGKGKRSESSQPHDRSPWQIPSLSQDTGMKMKMMPLERAIFPTLLEDASEVPQDFLKD